LTPQIDLLERVDAVKKCFYKRVLRIVKRMVKQIDSLDKTMQTTMTMWGTDKLHLASMGQLSGGQTKAVQWGEQRENKRNIGGNWDTHKARSAYKHTINKL